MTAKQRILLVEDELHLLDAIKLNLELEGYKVSTATDGKKALKIFKEERFNLIILDVMLPEIDGFQVAETIRLENSEVPIMFLTAKNTSEDRVAGLKKGADDYLTKPFDSDVLLAKIKAILNRQNIPALPNNDEFEFTFSSFKFNSKLRFLTYKMDKPIKLSPKENQLLRLLVLHINDLLPRDVALNKIWRDDNYFTSRSMDVYIAKLRKYLSVDVKVQILNIHGEGFRLVID